MITILLVIIFSWFSWSPMCFEAIRFFKNQYIKLDIVLRGVKGTVLILEKKSSCISFLFFFFGYIINLWTFEQSFSSFFIQWLWKKRRVATLLTIMVFHRHDFSVVVLSANTFHSGASVWLFFLVIHLITNISNSNVKNITVLTLWVYYRLNVCSWGSITCTYSEWNNQSLCTHGSSVIKNNLIHFIILYTANQNTGLSKNNNFVLSKYMVIKKHFNR